MLGPKILKPPVRRLRTLLLHMADETFVIVAILVSDVKFFFRKRPGFSLSNKDVF